MGRRIENDWYDAIEYKFLDTLLALSGTANLSYGSRDVC